MDQGKFGKFLSELRNEKGMTQDELAEKLNVSSGKIISKWENGVSMPDFDTIAKLAEILDVTLYEMHTCEKLKKPYLIQATKDKIKSSKDILKLEIQRKILVVIAIIIGIILGLCAIFTIDNYNTVKIYTLESIDSDFCINGNIVEAKDYNIFNLINIGCINKNNCELDIDATNIEYEILKNSNRILLYSNQIDSSNNNATFNLNDNVINTRFMIQIENTDFTENEYFVFKIRYLDDDKIKHEIDFKFRIIKRFQNIL